MSINNFKLEDKERGSVKKKLHGYLLTMQLRTSAELCPAHPRHHGVPMEAHHALSEKGIALSKIGEKLEDFGYNINDVENLVFIPSTLQGACLLQVQPHRGDHRVASGTAPDIDANRENCYHDLVASAVKDIFRTIGMSCGEDTSRVKGETKKCMDKLSAKFIKFIQKKPSEYRLTRIAENFTPGNLRGCGGRNSVTEKSVADCPVQRKHTGKHGIKFACSEPYILKPGN